MFEHIFGTTVSLTDVLYWSFWEISLCKPSCYQHQSSQEARNGSEYTLGTSDSRGKPVWLLRERKRSSHSECDHSGLGLWPGHVREGELEAERQWRGVLRAMVIWFLIFINVACEQASLYLPTPEINHHVVLYLSIRITNHLRRNDALQHS